MATTCHNFLTPPRIGCYETHGDHPTRGVGFRLQVHTDGVGAIGNSAPVSIIRRAPPSASCSLVSPQRKRTKPSPCLFHSTEERRSPESCSSFRSREQPHVGFTTVVLGCRTWATLGGPPSRFLARPGCGVRRTDARKGHRKGSGGQPR